MFNFFNDKVNLCFCIIICILIYTSCDNDNKNDTQGGGGQNRPPTDFEIAQPEISGDTLYVYTNNSVLNFSFKGDDRFIIFVVFVFNGTDTTIVESVNGHFLYSLGFLNKGLYNLQMYLITNYSDYRGSGDLSDCKNCFYAKKLFLRIIDDYYTFASENIVNGYLKISFQRYMNPDLAEYEISRYASDGLRVVGRVKIPEFTDSTYVGEGGNYKIKVNTTSGDVLYWGEANFNNEIPMPAFYSIPEKTYYLAWNKSKFFNAVDKYYAILSNSAEGVYFDSPDDTIMILNDVEYGQVMSIWLRTIPKKGNIVYEEGSNYPFQSFTYFTIGK